jgi:adenosylcobinamide kinase/adenosylcobinamide-phosphate guanylyltransferase
MKGRTIFITGGARSGKSAYAESLYAATSEVIYLATARITDDEMRERVERHKRSRPSGWRTIEQTYDLHTVCKAEGGSSSVLLDCVCVLTSNIMLDLMEERERIPPALQHKIEQAVIAEIEKLIQTIQKKNGFLVMVTNEVGDSVVPENHLARVYRDILGRVNQHIAALCDEVYLVTCGIPLRLK